MEAQKLAQAVDVDAIFWNVALSIVVQYTECKYGGPLRRRPGRATWKRG